VVWGLRRCVIPHNKSRTKQTVLPGEIVKRFTVTTEKVYRGTDPVTIDGNHYPDMLTGEMVRLQSYVGVLRRRDSRFSLHLEWVDVEGKGHRVELPHELVERIVGVRNRIIDEAISDRAVRAMETRMKNGYIPTFAKRKMEKDAGETEIGII